MSFSLTLLFTKISLLTLLFTKISLFSDLNNLIFSFQFSQWLKDDLVITVFLEQRVATVFAPTNDAVNKYLEELNKRGIQRQDERIVSLHVGKLTC